MNQRQWVILGYSVSVAVVLTIASGAILDVMNLPLLLVGVLVVLMSVPFFAKKFDLFAPVTLVTGAYLGFILGALVSISRRMSLVGLAGTSLRNAELLSTALLYLILGLACYYVGYFAIVTDRKLPPLPTQPPEQQDLRPEIFLLIALYAFVGSITYYFLFVRPMGGWGVLIDILGQDSSREILVEETGATALGLWVILAAHSLWFSYRAHTRAGYILFGLYSLAVAGLLVLNAVALSAQLLAWAMSLIIRYRYSASGRTIRVGQLLMASGGIVALVLVVYGMRLANKPSNTDSTSQVIANLFSVEGVIEKFVERRNVPDINIIAQLLNGVPREIPFQYGKTFISIGARLYARVFNQELSAARTVGQIIRDRWYNHPGEGGKPPTLIGELFLNFGWPGILLGMFGLGVVSGYLYRWIALYPNDQWAHFVYSFVAVQIAMFIKTDFSNTILNGLFWIVPVLVTVWAIQAWRMFNKNITLIWPNKPLAS